VGRVFAGLVGSSEANMREALKMAEAVAPSILWMDEIEKGFGDTTSSGDSGTSSRVFGSFLTWMQEKEKPVFVIATANNIDKLPPEFLRKGRFDEIFFVDLPTNAERQTIWKLHLEKRLSKKNLAGSVIVIDETIVNKLSELSEGFSGAEIEQAVIASLFDAFGERRPVQFEDLERAVRNTVPLSITQAEKIKSIRGWASTRAVAATATEDSGDYGSTDPDLPAEKPSGDNVSGWRGGRKIEF
jgi:SpoVK/Ycf46/Vps4 family AAA+-type ATPase